MSDDLMLLGFEEYEAQAQCLSEALGQPYARVAVHHFPDGESKVNLPAELPAHVVFCRSLDRPNNKLIELLLAARTARKMGVKQLTLVAPYICYMRQDKAFNPGEGVSQRIIGQFIAELFDNVITVDPHLHRTHHFADAVPAAQAVALSATEPMLDFLCSYPDTILLGPDQESEQWVRTIAKGGGLLYGVANKQRLGDREIQVTLPDLNLKRKPVVLVDDVVSSGETIAITAQRCLESGAKRVDVLVTHPLFAQGAIERLQQVGVSEIWSTNSIPHSSNCIALTDVLAKALQTIA